MKRPTPAQIKVLTSLVDHLCEQCGKKFDILIPHRIVRGYAGGKYNPRNILMVCPDCHREMHRNEPGIRNK